MQVVREEVFGPVLAAMPFDDVDDAIRQANDSPYGLAASVWSNDLSAVHRIVPRLKAGTVWVNTHNMLDANLPFGGYKQSGFGRDLGRAAVESYTEVEERLHVGLTRRHHQPQQGDNHELRTDHCPRIVASPPRCSPPAARWRKPSRSAA